MRVFRWFVVLAVLGVAGYWFVVKLPYGPSAETFVDIAPGTGTVRISEQLQRAGIVRSAWAFEGMKAVKGGSLKAGEYRFDHPMTLAEVYARVQKGDVYTLTLVIPEGYNIFDVAGAVQAAGLGSSEEFLKAEREHTELVKAWSPRAESVEGYLFPDTYKFGRHATAVSMLATMVRRFGVVVQRLRTDSHPTRDDGAVTNGAPGHVESPGDVGRLVTMASLVEKEVHVDAERPVVAGVFVNRLAAGMPLQTDPAVAYASLLRGTWTGTIHQSELHSDSAYNTYVHVGLPPGPICNPGVAALKAVLHPATTEDLYFVARPDGTTAFSATLAEHNAQVAALLGPRTTAVAPAVAVKKPVRRVEVKKARRAKRR